MSGSRTHSKVQQRRRTCPGLLLKATSQVGLHHLYSVAAFSPDSNIHSLNEISIRGEMKIAFEMFSAALEIMFIFTLLCNRACVSQIVRIIHKVCFVFCIFRVRTSDLKLSSFLSLELYVARRSCRSITKRMLTASLQIIPV